MAGKSPTQTDEAIRHMRNITIVDSVLPKSTADRYDIRLSSSVLAGVADGFNPCAFSIVISLAGILAVGGRKRRARVLGGWAFCLGVMFAILGILLLVSSSGKEESHCPGISKDGQTQNELSHSSIFR